MLLRPFLALAVWCLPRGGRGAARRARPHARLDRHRLARRRRRRHRRGRPSDTVVAVYRWDEAAGAWLTFLPGLEDVPGLNTLTTLQQGSTYWVAVTEPLTWTLETRAPDER